MTEVLTSAQMRAIEATAISSGITSGLALMEQAGRGVVEAVLAAWPEVAPSGRALVLCGPGNNGGDGFVVARLLAEAGWTVKVMALGPTVTPDAQAMRDAWSGAIVAAEALDWADFRAADLVIDAMFGTGLGRAIAPGVWRLLEMAKTSGCKLVAVDILSGICADSGRVRAEGGYLEWPADLTVTFEQAKLGHYLDQGGRLGGRLVVVPLGLQRQMDDLLRHNGEAVAQLATVAADDLAKGDGHKFSHGHVLVLAGGVGRGGAARLAARGALRLGAGLVTVACPPEATAENAMRLEAIMLHPLADAAALSELLADARINVLCLGPGLGVNDHAASLVAAALQSGRRLVLDADALTVMARDTALFDLLHEECVLTPHAGEFARLFVDLAAKLAKPLATGPGYSKIDACRAAAARAGCVVLLKGPDTVIAAPDGRAVLNSARYERTAPWLATAGAGDVLAGFIAGLMARGNTGFAAAQKAAWLHVEAARAFGPGLIAEDLPETLPKVLRGLGL